jgi:hypothetical protein
MKSIDYIDAIRTVDKMSMREACDRRNPELGGPRLKASLCHPRYCGYLDSPSRSRERLPTLNQFANSLKDLTGETFGEVVGALVVGVDFEHEDLTRLHMAPEEVPFDVEVLGTRGETLIGGQNKGAIVVFEDGAME